MTYKIGIQAPNRGNTIAEVIKMPKKGMRRIERTNTQPRNDVAPVPEIEGKAKSGKKQANPIIATSKAPAQKVYHTAPFSKQKPRLSVYPTDSDLSGENIE